MEEVDGSWAQPGVPLWASTNESWTEPAEPVESQQTQLVLKLLVVLMCLGAVTGTESAVVL